METGVLEDLGLSNAEAKLYLALLQLGSSKTGEIILKTKLQSSTVYHVLQSLIEKGLVSYILRGKIKYYQAEHPEAFILFMEEKRRRFDEILPSLKAKERFGAQKQSAKVYEGVKGLKTAFNDILESLKEGDEYYFFQVQKEKLLNKRVISFLRNYHNKRSKKGIRVKGIATKDMRKNMKDIFTGLKYTQIRYVDGFLPNGVIIYKNKVITLDLDARPAAFVIESRSVANSYRKFFEEKWDKIA